MRAVGFIILLALLIIASTCFFFAGVTYERQHLSNEILYPGKPSEEITYEQALKYLARAKYSHQYYIDNPRESENISHHMSCVERYNAIIDFIKRQDSYINNTLLKEYQNR